jgi:uncharacterized protein YeaO (DUF488 family)
MATSTSWELDRSGRATAASLEVHVRSMQDHRRPEDGIRVLVDRFWPPGVSEAQADIDDWCIIVAPSAALTIWFEQDHRRFHEFACRYRAELSTGSDGLAGLRHLVELASRNAVSLMTASPFPEASSAAVLAGLLRR